MERKYLGQLDHFLVDAALVDQVPHPLRLPVEVDVFSASGLFLRGQLGRTIAQGIGLLRGQRLLEHDVTVFVEMGPRVLQLHPECSSGSIGDAASGRVQFP